MCDKTVRLTEVDQAVRKLKDVMENLSIFCRKQRAREQDRERVNERVSERELLLFNEKKDKEQKNTGLVQDEGKFVFIYQMIFHRKSIECFYYFNNKLAGETSCILREM